MATPIDKATHVLLAEHFNMTRSVLLTSTDPDIDVDEVGKELEKIDDVEKIVKRGNDFLVQFVSESGVVDIGEIVPIGENTTLAVVIPTPKTQSAIRLEELEAALKKSEWQRGKSEGSYLRDRKMWEEQMTRMEELMRTLSSQPSESRRTRSTDFEAPPDISTPSVSVQDKSTNGNGSTIQIPISGASRDAINVQVEHLVKSDRDHSAFRLRPFSGNAPKSGEVDYEEWARQVELLLEDNSVSDHYKRQRLLSSLHTPAIDLARSLGDVSSRVLFEHMESLYGSTSNGVRLLHDFFQLRPGQTEKNTDYLQRLGVMINKVVKKGGMQESQIEETLLTHFKSTCGDERLSNVLHVKYDNLHPPKFQDLMREVKRIEELNTCQRKDMSKHKTSQARAHTVADTALEKMQKRMDVFERNFQEWTTSIGQSIQTLRASPAPPANNHSRPVETHVGQSDPQRLHQRRNYPSRDGRQSFPRSERQSFPRSERQAPCNNHTSPMFVCFNCGEHGHYSRDCRNPPNPPLVHERLNGSAARETRQGSSQSHLNGGRPSTQ